MPLKNTIIHYFIAATLSVLGVKANPWWLLVLVAYLVAVFARLKVQKAPLVVVVAVFFMIHSYFFQINDRNLDHVQGRVVSLEGNKAVIATAKTRILVYFENASFDNDDLVELTLSPLKNQTYLNPGGFDYRHYLKTQGISQTAWVASSSVVREKSGFKDYLAARFSQDNPVSAYGKMFVLGIKDENINGTAMVELSIIHLFALSGMHLEYLKQMIKKILGLLHPGDWLEVVSYSLIGLYLVNIPLNIAFTRAFGVGILAWLCKDDYHKLDCLAWVGLIFLIKNPYMIFSLSFIFSFTIYLILLLLGNCKFSEVVLFIGSLPLVIAINYRINLIGLVLTMVIGPFVKWFYLLVIVNFWCNNVLDFMVMLMITVFENILNLATRLSLFVNFGKPSWLFLVLYYGSYFLMIARISGNLPIKKNLGFLMGLTITYSLALSYSPIGQVVMIDVGQGDCFLIKQPFNQGNILIDTGGNLSFDLAQNVTVPYLRSMGVFDLDCVILSHDDFDHSGAYESLAKLMPIQRTIKSAPDELVLNKLRLEFLNLPDYQDKNDNSLVVFTTINGLNYLFLGDVSKRVEEQLCALYPDLKIDVVKIAHHGSNTSTSERLLQVIEPKLALVSVGRDNHYNHPSIEVVALLESYGITIYRTDLNGALAIKYLPGFNNYLFPYVKQL